MNYNNILAILISILIVVLFLGFQMTLSNPIYAPDGTNNYNFISGDTCDIGYPNGLCIMTNWLGLTKWQLWSMFFIISLIIPIMLVYYTKNIWLFPFFFVFTGFYFNTMAMQVFTQILMAVIFLFFVFEKSQKNRLLVLNFLLISFLSGFKIHNTEMVLLIIFFVYEFLVFVNVIMGELFELMKLNQKLKVNLIFLSCGVVSKDIVFRVSTKVSEISSPMQNNTGNFFHNIIYYSYSFFWENMFVLFVIFGIIKIFTDLDFRKIYYLIFLIGASIFLWWLSNFEIWWVTRVIIFLPIVLIVPFYNWFIEQSKILKFYLVIFGIIYFLINFYYFVIRIQGMSCL